MLDRASLVPRLDEFRCELSSKGMLGAARHVQGPRQPGDEHVEREDHAANPRTLKPRP